MKKFIFFSPSNIPQTKDSKTDGGGLRVWGLAKGLSKKNIKITIAIPQKNKIINKNPHKNIKVINWNINNVVKLINQHDSFYLIYPHTDIARIIYEKAPKDKPMIVDCYVPMYIESLVYDIPKNAQYLNNHLTKINEWNLSFLRGDYFLCANKPQFHLYHGILSAAGRINPVTKINDLLSITPFGIDKIKTDKKQKNPYKKFNLNKNDKIILWFGGIYPWFNITPLLKTMKEFKKSNNNLKLFIVGGKNPFVKVKSFTKLYDNAVKFAKDNNMLNKNIFFIDWIVYSERFNYYNNADLIVNLHKRDIESNYSWRTRLVDFVSSTTPLLTSGGDEVTRILNKLQAAIILKDNSSLTIKNELLKYFKLSDQKKIEIGQNMEKAQKHFYWSNIVKELEKFIKNNKIASDRNLKIKKSIKTTTFHAKKPTIASDIKNGIITFKEQGLKRFFEKLIIYIKKKF